MKDKPQKPFPYKSWSDLQEGLETMKSRSILFKMVKAAIERKGHWRRKPRGGWSK